MRITYIGHSGFFVETESAAFLFDYYQGGIPALPEKKKCFVFVSHKHPDHYQRAIFEWEERGMPVFYILSKDVRRDVEKFVLPAEKQNGRTAAKELRLEDRISYVKPGQELEIADCKIRTLRSTDEGVAYVIWYQGQTMYHAGDLNAWYWEEEGERYCAQMRRDYEGEIRKMKKGPVDVAFVPVDPRLGEQYVSGLDFFMREVGVKAVFPMHFWGDYGIFERLQRENCTKEYRDRIMEIQREGQVFEVS